MRGGLSAIATTLLALGAGIGNAEELTFSIGDETAPAGSFVQMKVRETEPTPISGGRGRMRLAGQLAGVSLIAPTGEAGGAALLDGGSVTFSYVTSAPFSGGDYPILTVSLRLSEDLPAGSSAVFTLDPAIWTVGGQMLASKASTGTVTVGGTLAITDVVPAGATFPEGTVISVRGVGFDGITRLRLNGNDVDDAQVVSPNEIQFTLSEATNMAGAELRADDSLGEKTTYYSYLRGIPAAISKRALLASTVPMFSGRARAISTFGSIPLFNPAFQYAALALQNPNLESAKMTIVLFASNGRRLGSASRSLASGHRLLLELSELLPGKRVPPGSSVRVSSPRPIQMFGLIVDERIRSVTPRLPMEAAP